MALGAGEVAPRPPKRRSRPSRVGVAQEPSEHRCRPGSPRAVATKPWTWRSVAPTFARTRGWPIPGVARGAPRRRERGTRHHRVQLGRRECTSSNQVRSARRPARALRRVHGRHALHSVLRRALRRHLEQLRTMPLVERLPGRHCLRSDAEAMRRSVHVQPPAACRALVDLRFEPWRVRRVPDGSRLREAAFHRGVRADVRSRGVPRVRQGRRLSGRHAVLRILRALRRMPTVVSVRRGVSRAIRSSTSCKPSG